MKEEELKIDRSCHAVYSDPCKEAIRKRIREHYDSSETDAVFEKIQHQYEEYLAEFSHKDLGGSRNHHNGTGGTYDCIMLICYYVVCKDKTSFDEVQKMEEELIVGTFGKLNFVNLDKPVFKRLMYLAFRIAAKKTAKWNDYEMHVDPYSKDKHLHYCFTRCPFADFVHQFHMEEIARALCNVDYPSMDVMNVKLIRQHTCIESDHCDYTFCSPQDPYYLEHPEYVDEMGFIRNRFEEETPDPAKEGNHGQTRGN